ncbi:MAG TPA: hypothetical protein VFV38_36475 [Ktedonobacteraceae bacterium]|nr:hypothetical protein [Ktedonobacteraceae bacterium]
MLSFVRGILEAKSCEYGAYCNLVLRVTEEIAIPVFNSAPRGSSAPLSAQWAIGMKYHLLLKVRAEHITYHSTFPAGTVLETVTEEFQAGGKVFRQMNIAQGRILDPFWDATQHSFQAVASSQIYKQFYVLVETAIGNILISRDDIASELGEQAQQLSAGGYLKWEPGRIDLWALLPAEPAAMGQMPEQSDKEERGVEQQMFPQDSEMPAITTFVRAQLEELKCDMVWCTFKLRVEPDVLVLATEPKDVTKPDPGPLAAQMSVNTSYHLLLMVNALHPTCSPQMPAQATLDVEYRDEQFISAHEQERFIAAYILEGRVINPSWDAASQQYQAITDLPWFYRERYVLLETAIGHVVISHRQLERSLSAQQIAQILAGGYMEWSPSRMTLLALL